LSQTSFDAVRVIFSGFGLGRVEVSRNSERGHYFLCGKKEKLERKKKEKIFFKSQKVNRKMSRITAQPLDIIHVIV
jgi:predicted RNA-binding protein YlxR (DUF448 family)